MVSYYVCRYTVVRLGAWFPHLQRVASYPAWEQGYQSAFQVIKLMDFHR